MLILGDTIPKLYKSKKGQLMVYLPFDVAKGLGLKEGDELDFLPYEGHYLIAKKSELVAAITHKQPSAAPMQQPEGLDPEELAVLKKMDKIRYSERTKERLKQVLNENERKVISRLIKKKIVSSFKKAGEQEAKYGISKEIYNKFLLGHREMSGRQQPAQQQQVQVQAQKAEPMKKWEKTIAENQGYLELLEANGFLVVQNQAEASAISAELEESIRRGLVVGTRAFNRKYYITLKSFVTKNAAKVMKQITEKGSKVEDIAAASGIDEEGVRAILYILAENGEVAESKRDFFKLA